MTTTFTHYFNNIFPSYKEWREFSEQIDSIDFNNPIHEAFDKWCFKILQRQFSHWNIRYFETDAFKLELAIVYENKFIQFLKEKELIDKIYNLSDDEILEIDHAINNMANNPNNKVEDPKKPLNFISAQTYNLRVQGKARTYLERLNSLPTLNIYKFLHNDKPEEMGFEDLFVQIIPNQDYIYF